MATLDSVENAAAEWHLAIMGLVQPGAEGSMPEGCETLVLLGPAEPGFWPFVTASPEFADGAPDPLDRWSTRAIATLAHQLGARAVFPFGGPPHAPFFSWAVQSGRAWPSPVSLLVHDAAGLMVSYRGALALSERLVSQTRADTAPCMRCAAPCETACPVGALTPAGYDLDRCHEHLARPEGQACMTQGCAVRRACPISQNYGRLPEQSAFHMRQFHR